MRFPLSHTFKPLLPIVGAVVFASCAQHPVPVPSPPIVTPVRLEVAPSNEAVEGASKATAAANAVVEMQAKELRDVKADVAQAHRLAADAYESGLVAGSERALLLRDVVQTLQRRVDSLTLMNDSILKDLGDATALLDDALSRLAELREEVGRAEQALTVQTQLADGNRVAFEAQVSNAAELAREVAVQTDRKERWRVAALVSSGLLLAAAALTALKFYIRPF